MRHIVLSTLLPLTLFGCALPGGRTIEDFNVYHDPLVWSTEMPTPAPWQEVRTTASGQTVVVRDATPGREEEWGHDHSAAGDWSYWRTRIERQRPRDFPVRPISVTSQAIEAPGLVPYIPTPVEQMR